MKINSKNNFCISIRVRHCPISSGDSSQPSYRCLARPWWHIFLARNWQLRSNSGHERICWHMSVRVHSGVWPGPAWGQTVWSPWWPPAWGPSRCPPHSCPLSRLLHTSDLLLHGNMSTKEEGFTILKFSPFDLFLKEQFWDKVTFIQDNHNDRKFPLIIPPFIYWNLPSFALCIWMGEQNIGIN